MSGPDFSLAGRTVLVIGASGGLGGASATAAAALGAHLILSGRRPETLESLAAACATAGALSTRTVVADVVDAEARTRLVASLPELDGVVFASGITLVKPLRVCTPDDLRRVLSVNLEGLMLLTQMLVRGRRLRNGASLVYLASIAARLGAVAHTFYSASKGGLVAFVRSLALELAPAGVRANVISPGLVRTPMAEQMGAALTAEQLEQYAREYPLGLGEPADVAGLAAYLLSPAARWVTGQDWAIDGGVSVR